jgi:hypothetical protein
VDLRVWGGPIKDQGEEGSCTGHVFLSAREWIARGDPSKLFPRNLRLEFDEACRVL